MTRPAPDRTHIALLRGVNVGGHNRLAMAALRAVAGGLGLKRPRTYIQSGNLVFETDDPAASVAGALERAIAAEFGLAVPVIVRTAEQWTGYVAANPFPDASATAPSLVMLALSKEPPVSSAAADLRARVRGAEEVRAAGGAIWIHYAAGAGRSAISPGVLDDVLGSPVTTRNWSTVLRLAELVAAPP